MTLFIFEVNRGGHTATYVDTCERLRATIGRSWPGATITGAGYLVEVWIEGAITGHPYRLASITATPVRQWPGLPERL